MTNYRHMKEYFVKTSWSVDENFTRNYFIKLWQQKCHDFWGYIYYMLKLPTLTKHKITSFQFHTSPHEPWNYGSDHWSQVRQQSMSQSPSNVCMKLSTLLECKLSLGRYVVRRLHVIIVPTPLIMILIIHDSIIMSVVLIGRHVCR